MTTLLTVVQLLKRSKNVKTALNLPCRWHVFKDIHIQLLHCTYMLKTLLFSFCQRITAVVIVLVNKECLSSFSSACELGNDHTPLFVSPIIQNHAHPHSAEFTVTQRCLFVQQRQAFIILLPQEKLFSRIQDEDKAPM